MSMVCGLDLHREQITFDAVVPETGEVWRGRVHKPDRQRVRSWLERDVRARAGDGSVRVAVEGCTGWRYVVEEITAAGFEPFVAEPADTQAARGRKRHAKTDRSDACLLRQLLEDGDLPESWIPPTPVLEWRERARVYKSLIDQRTVWCQRVHAELFQHGIAVPETAIRAAATRERFDDPAVRLSPAARERIAVAYRMIDAAGTEIAPLAAQLRRFGGRQPACRALVDTQFGIGELLAVVVWSELGDCRRFRRSHQAVRHAGLDITVDQSDRRRASGFLSRQGSPLLRWALYEAGMQAGRANSPDHEYFASVKANHDGKLAAISVARKLARRCYHVLRNTAPNEVYAIPD
jgi:transposase